MPLDLTVSRRELPVVFKDKEGKPDRLAVLRETGVAEQNAHLDSQIELREIAAVVVDGKEVTPATTKAFYKDAYLAGMDKLSRCLFYEVNQTPQNVLLDLVGQMRTDADGGDARLLAFWRRSVRDPEQGAAERSVTMEELCGYPVATVDALMAVVNLWDQEVQEVTKRP